MKSLRGLLSFEYEYEAILSSENWGADSISWVYIFVEACIFIQALQTFTSQIYKLFGFWEIIQ